MISFDPVSGVVMKNAAGTDIWKSSNQQGFVTNYKTGTLVIPALISQAAVKSTVVKTLATGASNATDLLGWFEVISAQGFTGASVIKGAVHQLGGTTIIAADQGYMVNYGFYAESTGPNESSTNPGIYDLGFLIALTTYVKAGKLIAEIDTFKPGTDPADKSASFWSTPIAKSNITIKYHAFMIAFDN
jgi:hypothetical protein